MTTQNNKFIDRFAVLGYGYWGPNIVRNFCQLLGEESVLVCEPDLARQTVARERHPGVSIVADWSDLLHNDLAGAVSLCTPAGMHAEQAQALLAAGYVIAGWRNS